MLQSWNFSKISVVFMAQSNQSCKIKCHKIVKFTFLRYRHSSYGRCSLCVSICINQPLSSEWNIGLENQYPLHLQHMRLQIIGEVLAFRYSLIVRKETRHLGKK